MVELTDVKIEFLRILESFLRNKPYCWPKDMTQLDELYMLSQQHHMTAAVFEQIRKDNVWNNPEPQSLFLQWKKETMRDVIAQMQRTEGFLAVYEKLCDVGIKPLVVKGIICRNRYSRPDYRISGDEDILIRKVDYNECDRILCQEGFLKSDPVENAHEISYQNMHNGVHIELHLKLFPEESGAYGHLNEEFLNVFENCICEEILGKVIWTFSPTDHLFYLICHSFKHFLHSGFGVRQVCDIVLMAEQCGKQIDWVAIKEKLERLHMKNYWDALVQIGECCFSFSRDVAGYPDDMYFEDVDYMPMLEDLLDSGIYGDSSMERKHSSNMTLAAVSASKASTLKSIKASLFPDKKYMKEHYTWLNKYQFLLPVAYAERIVKHIFIEKKGSRDKNSVLIGRERMKLLRKYHIIE